MMNQNSDLNIEKIVQHWIETSDDDFKTMLNLYENKSYTWALFLGHISTEKLLKAYYVRKFQKHAPYIHNLFRLAELSEIELNEENSDWLDKITSFNLNARYDDYKREFNTLCTTLFAEEWIGKIKIIRQWIKSKL